ncbi:Generic methyltransferase [Sulfurimonas denitrificans DSM 1251]|uniref:tRNA U34 carboxymethyltransferase n=1 Tax=Sulfurimonas denitrificans (strain ATCC 33889 / DSM 1251) TaxID=326298 RepID=CMOB_SULDN|nr:tRNA 5-methoxyuridine(34)/uridine 5-oxyacetic acid(34) synthase CmoB [Sulfurimonas denitrificans]Q30SA5.1 RecName: Full=tRNA U34 carboxymethyltransferase [Sulfurimonas denitrificans DSM 1251]ABB44126.1 Generic methyltransferase [Sulfurimonas denitrificans DSM 1251]MDD3441865.1 tRNA 5-methoxyuridine(34)/uridine 5-oxyacetic acid(34) synthase CmoB [Sulfurimonas denitrificans]
MNINEIRKERQKWMQWKNIAPLREVIEHLGDVTCSVELGDVVTIKGKPLKNIEDTARLMMPWRKGPFEVFGTYIDSEWRSNIKYNLLRKHFNLKDRRVADIGCNNGYYLFRMQEDAPKLLVGFDPSPLFKTQFDFINRFVKSDIVYELLGVEHLEFYEDKFDTIFCLGVLYHRSDPVSMLKSLYKGLDKEGEVILDTFYIEGDEEICLSPASSYSKIPNIYFVPTISALKNWCLRAGFSSFEVLETSLTSSDEQRKTSWIEGESLEDFLDKNDNTKTVEGYPAPSRVYVRLKKGIK